MRRPPTNHPDCSLRPGPRGITLSELTTKAKKKPAQVPAFEREGEKLIAWKIEGDVAPSAGLPSYVRLLLRIA